MNYAKAIRILRAIKNLSQKQLGVLIGTDASFISRIEDGNRQPSLETLKAIAKECEISEIFLSMLAATTEDYKDIPTEMQLGMGKVLIDMIAAAE